MHENNSKYIPIVSGYNLTRLKEKLCEQNSARIYPCRNCFSCVAIEKAVKMEKVVKHEKK